MTVMNSACIPAILENLIRIDAAAGTSSSGKRASAKIHSVFSVFRPTASIACFEKNKK